MDAAKRTWEISFDGASRRPWIARPDKGARIIFTAADALVRFLVNGGLDAAAIRIALRTVEASGKAMVALTL